MVRFLSKLAGALFYFAEVGAKSAIYKGSKGSTFIKGLIQIDTEKRIDWNALKSEYLAGASFNALGKKYKCSRSTICERAKKEGWKALSEHLRAKTEQKTAEKTSGIISDCAVVYERMRQKALLKLERELDAVLEKDGTENRHTETWFSESEKRTVSETTISKLADILALMDKIAGTGFGQNDAQLKAIREILDGVPSAID